MKLRTKLTLKYASITAAILCVLITTIYYVSEHTRSEAFSRTLKAEAITKAQLFLNNKVDSETMQSIYLNNRMFIDEVEVAIYDTDFEILYHDASQIDIIKETDEMLNKIKEAGEIDLFVDECQGIGLLYEFNGKHYILTAAAHDGYGHSKQRSLSYLLIILMLCGLTILLIVGYLLARSTLSPIRHIIRETEDITVKHIDKRLPVKNERDELGELSVTLNELLDRIEKSFNSQKMFVSNVSHELRTPMAALSAELDLALQKERSPEQYRHSISNALQDSGRIVKLIDGLLNLAKADYEPEEIKMEPLRLDELLIDANELAIKAHPDYHIELFFDQESDDDDALMIKANPYLLKTAFVNLIENNCKYSENKTSVIRISFLKEFTIISFSDKGIGMSETDRENIFNLFYRGEEHTHIQGYGIGMTLAKKIINIHHGDISVKSDIGEGTTFIVRLPHL